MSAFAVVSIAIAVVVVALLLWAIITYNGFVALRNLVQEAWRQIDVELHRRHDLVPNLVETVRGYASHERAVFDEVTNARAAASSSGASPAQQAQQETALSAALGRLFAVAEAYPELRASQNFASLQSELTNTEDRIAAGRRFYNANVRKLNTRVETFPPNLIAAIFSFQKAEYFEANDAEVRAAPAVSFGGQGAAVPAQSAQGQPAPELPAQEPPAQQPYPGQPGAQAPGADVGDERFRP